MLRRRAVRLIQKPALKKALQECMRRSRRNEKGSRKTQGRMFVRYCVAPARTSSRRGASVEPNSFAFSYQVRAFAMLAATP
jgi:hypothetical protein